MILTKTPFRMSFVGGGSDMPSFYRDEMGAVISTSIDKYMYITVNKKFDGRIRLNYTKTEDVGFVDDIQHPLVRESLLLTGISGGVEIASMADIPSRGSGLGSSSSYTVGLLNALYAYLNKNASKEQLAREACDIEINRCREPIGKQDQYAAAFGGINLMRFYPNDSVSVDPIICSPEIIQNLQSWIITFYTRRTRSASAVLQKQSQLLLLESRKAIMRRMVQLVFDMKYELESNSLQNFGTILHENWMLKRELSQGVSDLQIDHWYQTGIKNGALGGKLLGAGNGGFMMFYADPEHHKKITAALYDLQPVKFNFDQSGTRVVFYQPN